MKHAGVLSTLVDSAIIHQIFETNSSLAYQNSWNLDARVGRLTLDAQLWTLVSGRWTLDSGCWTSDAER